jgi:hypothetical protein
MATWDNLPILIALPLALAAACMSGNAEARQQIGGYLAQVFQPQAIDLGADPGYLLGTASETIWPLPAQPEPLNL